MPSIGDPDRESERVAIVVIHGVGQAEPGECSASLVRALGEQPGVVVEEAAELLLLPDEKPQGKEPNGEGQESQTDNPRPTFPATLRHATVQSRLRLTFAELYWADLTRIGSGRIASMLGLFRVIFEAHYVIDAMLNPRQDWVVRGLRFVLLWLSWLMRGPIAGLTVATAAVFGAALYLRPQGLFGQWQPQHLFATVLAAVFLLSLALRLWPETRWDATWRTSLNWTLIFSGLFSWVFLTSPSALSRALYHPLNYALTALKDLTPSFFENYVGIHPSVTKFPAFSERADFVNVLYRNLIRLWILFGTIWVFAAMSMLSIIGILAWIRKPRRAIFAPCLAASGILTLQLALWTALVGTAVLPLLNRAQEIVAITAVRPTLIDAPARKDTVEVERLLDVADFPKSDYDWVPRLIFAYGFNGLIVIALILCGGFVFFMRRRLAARAKGADEDILAATARKLPRVLFSTPVLTVLILLTVIQLTFNIMFAAETQKNAFARYILDFLANFTDVRDITMLRQAADGLFASYLNVTMLLAWLLALVFPLLMGSGFNNAVHIARDLIDHQYGPLRGRVFARRRDSRLSDPARWPRRERIQRRLLQVLTALAKRNHYDRVIFLAHSQGSVVIYDYLRAAADYAKNEIGGAKPDVITFGSPLGHVYQHYFSEYTGVGQSLERLGQCVARWINLYRIDDYIGLWVGEKTSNCIENRPLNPGGHVDYWKEKVLAETILRVVAEKPTVTPLGSRANSLATV